MAGRYHNRFVDNGSSEKVRPLLYIYNYKPYSSCLFSNRHFFATHCEYVVAKRKHPLRAMSLRSRASFLKTISGPIGEAFKQQEPTPWQSRNSPSVQQTTPNVQFVGPTPSTTLSNTLIGTKEPVQGVPSLFLSQPLSSSPQSAHEELPPTNDHDRYSFRSPTSDRPAARSPQVGFALSTTISPRVAHYHPMMTTRSKFYVQSLYTLISVGCIDGRVIIRRGATMIRSDVHNHEHTKDHKFGGFPGPLQLISRLFKRAAPRTHDKFDRTMSMDTYTTLQSQSVPWLNFDGLVVGRNSNFHTESLTDEELEDVGGAEYRALKLLSILVPSVGPNSFNTFVSYRLPPVFCSMSALLRDSVFALAIVYSPIRRSF